MERRHMLAWFSALGISTVLRGTPTSTPQPASTYLPSCLHPNGRWVALPGPKGDPIELWDIHTGQRAAVLPGSRPRNESEPVGLGAAMATRNGNYSDFHGALFTGPSALVGSWKGYDVSYGWVVGLPGSALANRSIRAEEGDPGGVLRTVPKGAVDCLKALSSKEIYIHKPWILRAAPQGDVWSVFQGESQPALGELRLPEVADPGAHPAPCAAFSRSGDTVALSHHGCDSSLFSFDPVPPQSTAHVLLWSWRNRTHRPTSFQVGKGDICRIHPLDENRWVVALHQHTFCTRSLIPQGRTRLVELPSMKEFTPGIAETQPCQLGVDVNQSILVAQYGAGTVRCYDLATRRMTRLLTAFMPHQGLLAWGSDNRHLLAARPLGPACLWDRQGHSTKESGCMDELIRPPIAELGEGTRCLAWSVEQDLLIQGDEDGAVRAFRRSGLHFAPDPQTARHGPKPKAVLWQLPGDGSALRALSVVGREWLVGQEQEGRLRVWSLPQRRIQAQVQGHPLRANAMVIDLNNRRIFTGGHDGVRSWSFPDLKPGVVMDTQGHWVSSLALRGNHLAVGCLDGVIRLFDANTGQLHWKIGAHGGWVGGLDFSPTGILASGGEDCSVALWDPDQGGQLKRCQGAGNLPKWSPDGSCLAVYAHDRVKVLTPDLVFQDSERRHLKLDWGDDYT